MAKKPLEITSWIGGQSADRKYGPQQSFGYSRHLDFRKKASAISMLPAMTKDTASTILALPLNMLEVYGERFYAVDEEGNVYTKVTGAWSKLSGDVNTFQYGMEYVLQQDRLYICGDETISSVANAAGIFGTPTIENDTLGPSVDQTQATTGNTSQTSISISETDAGRVTFSPAAEPFYSIKMTVAAKGGGSVTARLHDNANNLLDTCVVNTSAMTNGQQIEFVFTNTPRMTVANGSLYHVHFTHTLPNTATTFVSTTSNDFSTAAYETWATRLVGDDTEHPMIQFLNFLCIGNERYLSVWEPITTAPGNLEYLRHRLTFPTGRQVIGLALWNDYLAIATGSWSNVTNGIANGRIYFWNGTSKNYDMILEIPEGAPQSLFSYLNRLRWVANGALYEWSGGDIHKIWQFPNTDTEFKSLTGPTYVNPHMMAVRNGVLMSAFPNDTADPAIEYGVYSYGQRDENYPMSAGFSYTISTGRRANTTVGVSDMQLGFLKNFGNDLYLGWADYIAGTYGIDRVGSGSAPNATGVYESLIIDEGRPRKSKEAAELYITCEPLPTGGSITPKYKIDRGSWVDGTALTTVGATEVRLNINKRYKEIEIGFTLGAGATTPIITSVELIRDLLDSEND